MKKYFLFLIFGMAACHNAYASGCRVDSTVPDSPASAAGLKAGDVIVAANGLTIKKHEDLIAAMNNAGSDLRLFVQRGERTEDITAAIAPAEPGKSRLGVVCVYADDRYPARAAPRPENLRHVPEHTLSLGAGAAFPLSSLDTGYLGGGEQTIGSTGFFASGQYLYAMSPRYELGFEAAHSGLGENSFDMFPFSGKLSMRSTRLMILSKFHSPRVKDSNLTPYGLFGLGMHITDFRWDVSPLPGYGWNTGNPTDSRSIVSDQQMGIAMAFGAGIDLDLSLNSFLSLEARLDLIGKNDYDATALGNDFGLQSAEAGGFNGIIALRYGYRFNTNSRNDPSSTPKPQPIGSDGVM